LKCEKKRGDIHENLPLLSPEYSQTKMDPFTISRKNFSIKFHDIPFNRSRNMTHGQTR